MSSELRTREEQLVKIGAVVAVVLSPFAILLLIISLAVIGSVASDPPPDGGTGGGTGGTGGSRLLPGSVPDEYEAFIVEAGTHCPEITAPLIAAQLEKESTFNPNAVSPDNAQGIAQFIPSTWAIWGKDYSGDQVADVWNAQDAIGSQADFMCGLVDMVKSWINHGKVKGDVVALALAAYNAGPGAVLAAGGMPDIDETTHYVQVILGSIKKFTGPGHQEGGSKLIEKVVAAAEAEEHDRYVWGANGPDAWDCSSLVQHAWRAVGVELPRVTYDQVTSPLVKRVPWQDRRRGDLIFFHIHPDPLGPDHVGLVLSDHIMIHASHPHPNPEDDIYYADYTDDYYSATDPIVVRVLTD